MSQIDPNSKPLAGAELNVPAADGVGAVNSDTLTLAEINSVLGMNFKDKESALKSWQETKNFVGKRQQAVPPEAPPVQPDPALSSELKSLREDLFYTQNPQYKDYRDVISTMGSNPAEVVESGVFKKVFEKVKVADEAEQSRSIVSSSNRLATPPQTYTRAIEIANSADKSAMAVATELAAQVLAAESQ